MAKMKQWCSDSVTENKNSALHTFCTVINSVFHLHFWVSIANFITKIIPFNTVTHCCCSEHEAQLPLRNRTSALFVANLLFSVVMTNSITSWTDDITQTANKLQHAKEQHGGRRVTPLSCDSFSRESLGIYAWSFYCQKIRFPNVHNSCYGMGQSAFNFKHRFSKPNKRRYKRALMHITLPFDAFFLQNQREYPHKLYTARNCSPCRWSVLLIAWLYLHQFSRYHLWQSHGQMHTNYWENKTYCEIGIQGHSRSCILISVKSHRGTAYHCVVVQALSVQHTNI